MEQKNKILSKLAVGAKTGFQPKSKKGSVWRADEMGNLGAKRVAIVTGDTNTRVSLEYVLERADDFSCAACFSSALEALAEIPRLRPDLVLMGIRMPGMSGIECGRRLKEMLSGLVVIFVTGLFDASTINEALQAGGDNFLVRPLEIGQCLATLRFSFSGRGSAKRGWATIPTTRSDGERGQLSDRENEVMDWLAKGLLYKEIEGKLSLSSSLLKKIQHKIFAKLGFSNRTEAVNWWLARGQ